jgi:hypothetical protein
MSDQARRELLTAIATWIVVGGANRIAGASVDQGDGGVTPDEAFKLVVTEWGRHVRGCAAMIVRAWESAAS